MTRRAAWLVPALLVLAVGAVAAEEQAKSVTMNGEFYWEQGSTGGDLEAVFTPTGDGAWDVAFSFEFQGTPHTYTGTASGALGEGTLTGEVVNESGKRTWVFEGSFSDGAFEGTHTEITEGERTRTGTIRLAS